MPLREEFERSGNWLFVRRSYIPILLAAVMVGGMFSPDYKGRSFSDTDIWEIACFAVSLIGLAVRIFTIGHTPAGTSGRNTRGQVARTLNTTGIYSIVRHPLYLGNFVIWIGISMYVHLWWVTVITVLAFWIYYERVMFAEEEYLRRKFGREYEEWASRTPAFVPRPGRFRKPDLPFSVRNALKREYSGFFAIVAAFTFLDLVSSLLTKGIPVPDPMWRIIFPAGLIIYLTLRTLKRSTRLLSVEGR